MPVKMYSSGMHLRLGFAIASHLDPDIFVVDEALAVGDAGFQAKCVERMTKLVAEGRTLLFVSHNLPAVESLCSRGFFLLDGHVAAV
jgi:ABC-type polysaccharide/polyol phosphate transport system ATPase subunit